MSDNNHQVILFQMSDPSGIQQVSSVSNALEKAQNVSNEAIAGIKDTIIAVAEQTREAVDALGKVMPDEYEVSFGLSIDLEGNVWVAKGTVGTVLNVTLKWNK